MSLRSRATPARPLRAAANSWAATPASTLAPTARTGSSRATRPTCSASCSTASMAETPSGTPAAAATPARKAVQLIGPRKAVPHQGPPFRVHFVGLPGGRLGTSRRRRAGGYRAPGASGADFTHFREAGKEGAKAMASKNLGAVIQRAISDGAFRRQLQSDPAAALRGFNLSPDEIAAIRSGDSGKLMSLGVDQRMSKAFTVGGGFLGATRSTGSDLGGGGANTLVGDATVGTREGIVGDPGATSREALTTGDTSGVRAVNDVAPFEGNVNSVADSTASGTRAIHDDAPADLRSAASTGDLSGVRAVNDVAPFGSTATSATEDPNAPEFGAAHSSRDLSGVRAVNDSEPFAGN